MIQLDELFKIMHSRCNGRVYFDDSYFPWEISFFSIYQTEIECYLVNTDRLADKIRVVSLTRTMLVGLIKYQNMKIRTNGFNIRAGDHKW